MTPEDLTEIERVGRRCSVCHTGRRWRQFHVVRSDAADPAVMCPACFARYGATAAAVAAPPAAPEPAARKPAAAQASSSAKPKPAQPQAPREDRLKRALRELPHGQHSVARIAKAAGLNHDKALSRLHALQDEGEVQQIGRRWSNEPPSTDIEAAMDRLRAQTSNLRIIRERRPVG